MCSIKRLASILFFKKQNEGSRSRFYVGEYAALELGLLYCVESS